MLDDLAAEGHRKKNMKTLADLVEAGLDGQFEFPQGRAYRLVEALDERRPELPPALPGQGHLRHGRLIDVVRDGHPRPLPVVGTQPSGGRRRR